MTTLQQKPYIVKVYTKGEGRQNPQKFDHVVYGWPLKTRSDWNFLKVLYFKSAFKAFVVILYKVV